MQSVQETFNKMFDLGFYPQVKGKLSSTNYMTVALKTAYLQDVITKEEGVEAVNSISKYVGAGSTLFIFLSENEYPSAISDQIAIYKDWANRPQPKE